MDLGGSKVQCSCPIGFKGTTCEGKVRRKVAQTCGMYESPKRRNETAKKKRRKEKTKTKQQKQCNKITCNVHNYTCLPRSFKKKSVNV